MYDVYLCCVICLFGMANMYKTCIEITEQKEHGIFSVSRVHTFCTLIKGCCSHRNKNIKHEFHVLRAVYVQTRTIKCNFIVVRERTIQCAR